jgi:hypothetical protein
VRVRVRLENQDPHAPVAGDRSDAAVSRGSCAATTRSAGDFYGLDPVELAPALDPDTCE